MNTIQNGLRQLVPAAFCFALLAIAALIFSACDRKPTSEQEAKPMSKEEIKTKIVEKDIQPSVEALARKEKSIGILKRMNVPTIQHLPVIEDSASAKKRTKEEIAHRAIALCLVAVKGEGLEQAKVEDLVKYYGAQNYFTPAEKKFVENPLPAPKDRIQFSWQYEDYWVMLWALGYVNTLDCPTNACDAAKAVNFLHGKTTEEFIANAKLRDFSEILDEADLIYRYDWAAVNARLKKQDLPTGLDGGVVMERHHALNWLIGYMDQAWDDVTTDT
jgi:hypothetical protein